MTGRFFLACVVVVIVVSLAYHARADIRVMLTSWPGFAERVLAQQLVDDAPALKRRADNLQACAGLLARVSSLIQERAQAIESAAAAASGTAGTVTKSVPVPAAPPKLDGALLRGVEAACSFAVAR